MKEKKLGISAYSLFFEELADVLNELGMEQWRTEQVWKWLYSLRAGTWDEMTNLPKTLREDLGNKIGSLEQTAGLISKVQEDGGTEKLLLRMHDGELVETVVIPSRKRRTVCVSSQVGCAFGCVFCASGMDGVIRNLESGEIVAQVMKASRSIGAFPDNIVFMGMGEPFANYDNVLRAARLLNDDNGLNIGARKITFSTCGVVPGIKKLMTEGVQFELSVSLHAAEQSLREKIMPVAGRWNLGELMEACREYTSKTNRIITFEYTLIEGFNDGVGHARMLVKLLEGLKCRVNLIPLNPVEEFEGRTPSMQVCESFLRIISRSGINATLRRSKGLQVDASCGQLRKRQKHHFEF
ncbi:MAG: 23S rRNA (adenine(2503)-C(2))-methyltransferase RlmN [Lentisphaerae bacterium]|jgi:23S rRNA (adenine2503-C2)-methyltransferase|nr:23S rRNA (adenine(2503)-C(2))-methyltransferase RlmN [Lentisphaerota bacterium]